MQGPGECATEFFVSSVAFCSNLGGKAMQPAPTLEQKGTEGNEDEEVVRMKRA